MSAYRMFVKSAGDLANMPVANFPLIAGTFGEDQTSLFTASFTALDIPGNFETGDFCGVYDEYGRIVWRGLLTMIKDNHIEARQLQSLFDFPWIQKPISSITYDTVEKQLGYILDQSIFDNLGISLLIQAATTFTLTSTTTGDRLVTVKVTESVEKNVWKIISEAYESYNIFPYMTFPFDAGNLQIKIGTPTHAKVVVGDNAGITYNIDVGEEESFPNVLRVRALNDDGTWQWGSAWSLLKDGTYTQSMTPQPDRDFYHAVNVKILKINKNDWDNTLSPQLYLPPLIYNHNIGFDMVLENNLYDFFDWELGMPVDLWKDGRYYATKFTAWEMSFTDGQPASTVHITCGTARTKLTEVLNAEK